MNDPSTAKTTLRVLVLWDNEALLAPTISFVRGVAGEESRLMLLPVACGPAEGGGETTPQTLEGDATEILDGIGQVSDSVEEIIAIADARAADLIVMATTCCAVGALDHSCGAAELALDSPIPVLLLRTHDLEHAAVSPIRRVLVPLDGSARAAQALPLASGMARRLDIPVQFIMVIDPARVLPPAYAYDPEARDNIITDLRETAHWALKQAERQLEHEGVVASSSLLYGPVSTCIRAAIEPDDLLVMTTHGTGRAGPGGIGSVAARMVEHVTTPLVITRVRPQRDMVVDAACPWIEPVSSSSPLSGA